MCLNLADKEDRRPKYTTEDTRVYKLLHVSNGKIESPFFHAPYELGKLYISDLEHVVYFKTVLDETKPFKILPFILNGKIHMFEVIKSASQIDVGLHSFDSISAAEEYAKIHILKSWSLFECIIPKHSWYYINHKGEVASDKIIIKRPL